VKFLLDQGLPRSAAEALGQLDFEVLHTGAIGMATASDQDILERARREGEIVVTLDADVHVLLALSNAATPSVIRVRIEGLKGSDIAAVVSRVVAACEEDLVAGAMLTIDPNSIRAVNEPSSPQGSGRVEEMTETRTMVWALRASDRAGYRRRLASSSCMSLRTGSLRRAYG
jgi:predicted nuclease of predicted toxin-antitoxin system